MPVFIIMFGPPGSGKSTSLNMYLKNYLPRLNPKDIEQYNVDDFVYNNSTYKQDIDRLTETERKDKQKMREYFGKYKADAHRKFRRMVYQRLDAGANVAIDVAGRNVSFFEMYVDLVKRAKYEVHIMYPFVNSVNELMGRIFERFQVKGQTPVPKTAVEEAMRLSPSTLRKLFELFQDHLARLAVVDTSTNSFYNGNTIFSYDGLQHSCAFFNFKFEPCIHKLQGGSRKAKA